MFTPRQEFFLKYIKAVHKRISHPLVVIITVLLCWFFVFIAIFQIITGSVNDDDDYIICGYEGLFYCVLGFIFYGILFWSLT